VEEISGTSEQLLDFQALFTHIYTYYTPSNTKATASYKNLHRGEKTCHWDTTFALVTISL